MSWLRPELERLAPYVPGEQPDDPGIIKLNTNENPYPPSPEVIAALSAEIGPALRLYPHPTGAALRAALAALHGVAPEQVFLGNGSDEILALLIRAVVAPGQAVAAPDPTYSLYPTLAAQAGVRYLSPPFTADYQLPDDWPPARLSFLANPNSPSGTVLQPAAVAAFAHRLDGLLVVDEAYADFAGTDCLALVGPLPNVAVVRTFSKSYSLAGIRLGYLVGPAALVAGLDRRKDSYNVNRLALAAGLAAVASADWMRANAERIGRTRALLCEALAARGLEVYPSGANFVLVRLGPHAHAVQQALLRRKVLVRWFDHPRLRDCLRVTIGSNEQMQALLERLDEARREIE